MFTRTKEQLNDNPEPYCLLSKFHSKIDIISNNDVGFKVQPSIEIMKQSMMSRSS